jgi:hypothetical protein
VLPARRQQRGSLGADHASVTSSTACIPPR